MKKPQRRRYTSGVQLTYEDLVQIQRGLRTINADALFVKIQKVIDGTENFDGVTEVLFIDVVKE